MKSYRDIRALLEQKTGQINGAFSEVDLVPRSAIWNQAAGRSSMASTARPGSRWLRAHDRMNLVAKGVRRGAGSLDPGVLILLLRRGRAPAGCGARLSIPTIPMKSPKRSRTAMDMLLENAAAGGNGWPPMCQDENVHVWAGNFLRELESV